MTDLIISVCGVVVVVFLVVGCTCFQPWKERGAAMTLDGQLGEYMETGAFRFSSAAGEDIRGSNAFAFGGEFYDTGGGDGDCDGGGDGDMGGGDMAVCVC